MNKITEVVAWLSVFFVKHEWIINKWHTEDATDAKEPQTSGCGKNTGVYPLHSVYLAKWCSS